MLNLNLDFVIECIKTLCENTQCVTCDKLIGPCVRFPCGHSMCEGCAERAEECLFCITSLNNLFMVDKPQTLRLHNTLALLTVFQESFKIDVDKRQRHSDHLKLEKEVFPECIQAPNKYSNKRKSLNVSSTNKENIKPTIFLGELLSTDSKMNKNEYVQNWLNQHEDAQKYVPRKPFGDININTQMQNRKKNIKKPSKVFAQVDSKRSSYRKRSHFKSKDNSSLLVKPNWTNTNFNNGKDKNIKMNKEVEINSKYKCDRNESGIVIDDEPIFVDDESTDIIDKDQQAWLAVLEAAKKDDECTKVNTSLGNTSPHRHSIPKYVQNVLSESRNILFYRKSPLYETCKKCAQQITKEIVPKPKEAKSNEVSIVIKNSAYLTTIKFMQCVPKKCDLLSKSSVAIQTDKPQAKICYDTDSITALKRKILLNVADTPIKITKPNTDIESQDVFPTDGVNEHTKLQSISSKDAIYYKPLIVEESDTDSHSTHGNIHEVVAEVHSSNALQSVPYGILSTVNENRNQRKKLLRGPTPNSSDSSDKENVDPNRIKRPRLRKGKKNKNQKEKTNLFSLKL